MGTVVVTISVTILSSLTCIACVFTFVASESNLQNKRLKLDYEEITPCLKEVTLVWEKMLGTPGRAKVKFDAETIHAAVAQGPNLAPQIRISMLLGNVCSFFQKQQVLANIAQSLMYKAQKLKICVVTFPLIISMGPFPKYSKRTENNFH